MKTKIKKGVYSASHKSEKAYNTHVRKLLLRGAKMLTKDCKNGNFCFTYSF